MKIFPLLLLGLFVPLCLTAETRDTLAYFDPNTASAFYRDHGITAQAARECMANR